MTRVKHKGNFLRMHTPSERQAQPTPWYTVAFNHDYLNRYAHRNADAALRDLPFILDATKLAPGQHALDLCCGAGRYSGAIATQNIRITGMDLSTALLKEAAAKLPKSGFVRGDMRNLPFANDQFHAVINLFTSFGYFEREEEDLQVLKEVVRVLRFDGVFLMDFLNRDQALKELIPSSEHDIGSQKIIEKRKFVVETERLEKTIQMFSEGKDAPLRTMKESVRAYRPSELRNLLVSAGMKVMQQFGSLRGDAFEGDKSPRCVLTARRR